YDVIGPNLQSCLELVEHRDFAVTGRGAGDAFNFSRAIEEEVGSIDVVRRDNAFQRRLNHLGRRRRENVEIEDVAVDAGRENPVQKLNVILEPDALTGLVKMFPPYSAKLRIVQQQVSQFRA